VNSNRSRKIHFPAMLLTSAEDFIYAARRCTGPGDRKIWMKPFIFLVRSRLITGKVIVVRWGRTLALGAQGGGRRRYGEPAFARSYMPASIKATGHAGLATDRPL